MNIEAEQLRKILEGALLAAGHPLTIRRLQGLFEPADKAADDDNLHPEVPGKDLIQAALEDIQASCETRGYELKEVASGWRFQVREETAPWVNRLWDEKPQRYSRALLETLALIAYRQPITRGDIEEIRGVAVSSHIIKTLLEREWVKVIGHRDVPGRPSLYASTRQFLDYFNLKNLEDLPTLGEIRDLDELNKELDLGIETQIAKSAAALEAVNDEQLEDNDDAESEPQEDCAENHDLESHDLDADTAESKPGPEPEQGVGESDDLESTIGESEPEELHGESHDVVNEAAEAEQQSLVSDSELSDENNAPVDHEQEENPDPDFDDSFESASVTKEQHDA